MFYDATAEILEFEDLLPAHSGALAFILGTKHIGYIHKSLGDRYCLMQDKNMVPFNINDKILLLDNLEVNY